MSMMRPMATHSASMVRARRLDQRLHSGAFVAAEVVHHHDVAWAQFWDQGLFHPGLEDQAVDRAVDHEGGDHAAASHAGNQRGGLPMAMRHCHAKSLTARAAAVSARHVRAGPAFIDENQALGIEVELLFEPGFAADQGVRALLLGRVRSLFLRV